MGSADAIAPLAPQVTASTSRTLVDAADLPWPAVIRIVVCRVILGLAIGLTLCATLPALFGFSASTVVSGSMAPRIQVGDIALTHPLPADEYEVGQVVSFHDAVGDRLVLHRIVDQLDDGTFVTMGDANAVPDSTPLAPADIEGVGRVLVPIVGYVVVWAKTGQWLPVALAVLASAVVIRGSFRVPSLLPVGRRAGGRAIAEFAVVAVLVTALVAVLAGHVARTASAAFVAGTDASATWATAPSSTTCAIEHWRMDGNEWSDDGLGTFTIHVLTGETLPAPWTLTWAMPGDWVATGTIEGSTLTQDGQAVTLVSPSWAQITHWYPYQVWQVSVHAPARTWSQLPTGFHLNGQPCDFVPDADPAPAL